jgi:Protein of unknown function (DUF3054)
VRIALGLVLDAALILLFAAIGRRSHAETGAVSAVLTTAWPFLAGMAAGWILFLLAIRRVPLKVRDGIPVWICAVAIGMALRSSTHAGTALSFIVVATLVLGAMLLGWRGLAALAGRRDGSGDGPACRALAGLWHGWRDFDHQPCHKPATASLAANRT